MALNRHTHSLQAADVHNRDIYKKIRFDLKTSFSNLHDCNKANAY